MVEAARPKGSALVAPKSCYAAESAALLTVAGQVSPVLRFGGWGAYGTTMVNSGDAGLIPAPFSATMRT